MRERGEERGGEKLDTDNLAATFFSSFLSLWRKPQERKSTGQKAHWITFELHLHRPAGFPWIHTGVYFRINVVANLWIYQ